jgi:hypothetical protein
MLEPRFNPEFDAESRIGSMSMRCYFGSDFSTVHIRACVVIATGALTSIASAQWSVTQLHVGPSPGSLALAASTSGDQVGRSFGPDGLISYRAMLWRGSAASAVQLHPADGSFSSANAAHGSQQGGTVFKASGYRATIWSGTAASAEDLGPGEILAMSAGLQGGRVGNAAALWRGTAASFVNLAPVNPNPGGAQFTASQVLAVHGNRQVGSATQTITGFGDIERAAIWSGTAASYQPLPGPDPTNLSATRATAISATQIVGNYIDFLEDSNTALLWNAATLEQTELRAPNATSTLAYGVDADRQVGSAKINNLQHASLWSGTTASWIDLHTFVPAEFSQSVATSIAVSNSTIDITGYGILPSGEFRALLWSQPVPTPAGLAAFALAGVVCARRRR